MGEIRRYRRQYLSAGSLTAALGDDSVFVDSFDMKISEATDLYAAGVPDDDMPIEPIDTPLLVVTSSSCGLFSMITVSIRSMYSRRRSFVEYWSLSLLMSCK